MKAPSHPVPLPIGERGGVRGFRILVIGAYLEFGAWDLVLDGFFLEPIYLSFSL
jgi:hypothetical protein